MKSSISNAKANSNLVPKVLLQAKKEAATQILESEKGNSWEQGPWDEGHWANRK